MWEGCSRYPPGVIHGGLKMAEGRTMVKEGLGGGVVGHGVH